MYIERGRGCRIVDVDGHEYIDFLMAFGAFLLGYADPEVDAAARAELERGPLLSMNRPQHVLFAEALVERFDGADMAVLLKTGSEATTAALRIARRATGRRRVARAGYHGWHDWCLPLDPSVPAGLDAQVLEYDSNAPPSLEALFAAHPGEIAAVILAPEMVLPPSREVFRALQEVTHRHGAIFVLDEVKTAFRTAPGSVQARLGLEPDLTTLSKGLSNGWPVAAVVGRREVMRSAAGMHLSATYHGDTAAMAAALATLRIVEERKVADHVWALGQRLIDGLNAIVREFEVPATSYGEPFPPMPFLRFDHPDPATNDALRTAFFDAMRAPASAPHVVHQSCPPARRHRHDARACTQRDEARARAVRPALTRIDGRFGCGDPARRRPLPAIGGLGLDGGDGARAAHRRSAGAGAGAAHARRRSGPAPRPGRAPRRA